jgi:hypothetical protein
VPATKLNERCGYKMGRNVKGNESDKQEVEQRQMILEM